MGLFGEWLDKWYCPECYHNNGYWIVEERYCNNEKCK